MSLVLPRLEVLQDFQFEGWGLEHGIDQRELQRTWDLWDFFSLPLAGKFFLAIFPKIDELVSAADTCFFFFC